eukprot:11467012-Ditylum_brightwellii.AAC.1
MQDTRKARGWQKDLISVTAEVVKGKERTMKVPEFQFETTSEAADRNICIFRKYGNDLARALQAQQDTPLTQKKRILSTALIGA